MDDFAFVSCLCDNCRRPYNGHALMLIDDGGRILAEMPPQMVRRITDWPPEACLAWLVSKMRVSYLPGRNVGNRAAHRREVRMGEHDVPVSFFRGNARVF